MRVKISSFSLRFIFCITCAIFSTLHAEIVEVDRIEKILPHIKEDMLVIFDLDNTLVQTKEELGSDQWFNHRIQTLLKEEKNPDKARQRHIEEYYALLHLVEVVPVEKNTKEVFANIQKTNKVIAQTARGLVLHWATRNQLRSCGLDFSLCSIYEKDLYFVLSREVLWQDGVLFSQGLDKGEVLFHFFSKIGYHPKAICFVDDKRKALEQVERECIKRKIPFLGLRYSYLDKKVSKFETDKTDFQISLIKKAFQTPSKEDEMKEKIFSGGKVGKL